jgi:hypothetical protein
MSGPWFSYGQPNSYGMPASYGAPASYGRSMALDPAGSDPMLAQGLATTREALLGGLSLDERADLAAAVTLRGEVADDGLPPPGLATHLDAQGADERGVMVLFEALSNLGFEVGAAPRDGARLLVGSKVLVEVKRPPAACFIAELERVQAQAPLRAARAAEILTQLTPPHAYFATVLGLQPGRHAHTLELMQATLAIAHAVCQRVKVGLAVPRPSELSAQIQPMIDVPQHASFPAGHALQAHVTARLLTRLCPANEQQQRLLRALADRIAENRIVAGVHFPVDCRFGRLIGDSLSSWLLSACGVRESSSVAWRGGRFDGTALGAPTDFTPSSEAFSDSAADATRSDTAASLPLYARLWERAAGEWPALRQPESPVQSHVA